MPGLPLVNWIQAPGARGAAGSPPSEPEARPLHGTAPGPVARGPSHRCRLATPRKYRALAADCEPNAVRIPAAVSDPPATVMGLDSETGGVLAKVLATKKTERAGVNSFKAVMEAAGHIVQEIDGGNDYGEDCYLSFTELGRRTGDLAAVQIKSGVKYRRAVGYAIPCRDHIEDWTKSRIPVLGIVYDPEMRACYWVNLTEYLRRELGKGKKPKSVPVKEDAILEGEGIADMAASVRQYISDTMGHNEQPYRGVRGAITKAIDERRHQRESHFASAPVGGHPIPAFKSEADFLERHPNLMPRLLTFCVYGIMVITQAAMLPGLYEAAEVKYGGFLRISWLASYYGLIWYLLMIGRKDSHQGRATMVRYSAYLLICSGWYIAMGRYLSPPPWPVSATFEEIYVVAIPQVTKLVILFVGGHYLALEFGRRRRVAKAREAAKVEIEKD